MNSTKTTTLSSSRISTRDLVLAGMLAAILAIVSQISLPMPTGVPITIQVFGITLISVVFGWRLGLFGSMVYILLGSVGLPIFANFQGGLHIVTGLTGGYIWSWPLMAVLCGLRIKTSNKRLDTVLLVVTALCGLAVNEFLGGLQWALLAGDMSAGAVFIYSMTAFVPKDIVLTILAVFLGSQMRRLLARSGFLKQ